jgi:plasmid stabilization system protein ParE
MSLSVVLRPEAEADLHDAYGWYEWQQSGLGRRFVEQVSAAFDQLAEQPGM